MSIQSEITRLQGVKADILASIEAKNVIVPTGAMLADCPDLIASISGGGGFDMDNIVTIVPINRIVVVDSNGYIGYDLTNFFQYRGDTYYYNYAILSAVDNFSDKGMGQVTFYTPASDNIGGRVYNTVVIAGKTWMAENLDFTFSGLAVGQSDISFTEPRANYYDNDKSKYGDTGNKYGLLYNWNAVMYLEDNRAELIPGWHVPTIEEWDALATAVGGKNVAGTKLKSTTGWSSGNGDGTFDFNAFPAGFYNGSFSNVGSMAIFWTATQDSSSSAHNRVFDTGASMIFGGGDKDRQYSVRLVKDS